MPDKKPYRRDRGAVKIGRQLQAARERLPRSLEDAAAALNIPAAQLRALEEGDLAIFAAEVYARGVYSKYAAWLGLDSEQTARPFLRALSAGRVVKPLNLPVPERWYQRLINPRTVIIGVGALLAAAVSGYISWQVRSFWQLPDLALITPTDNVLAQETVSISGVSEPEARVSINEQSVLLQDDATFIQALDLRPGINIVRVEAENVAGRKRVIERQLLRPRTSDPPG